MYTRTKLLLSQTRSQRKSHSPNDAYHHDSVYYYYFFFYCYYGITIFDGKQSRHDTPFVTIKLFIKIMDHTRMYDPFLVIRFVYFKNKSTSNTNAPSSVYYLDIRFYVIRSLNIRETFCVFFVSLTSAKPSPIYKVHATNPFQTFKLVSIL